MQKNEETKESTPEATPVSRKMRLEQMAAEGNVKDLFSDLYTQGLGITQAHQLMLLRSAIRNFNGCPDEMLHYLMERIMHNDGYLLLKTHLITEMAIQELESDPGSMVSTSSKAATEWLERTERIEDRVLHMAEKYGRIRHLLRLGNKKTRADNIVDLDEKRLIRKLA